MSHFSWQDRVKGTAIFHKNCLRSNTKHTIRDTAGLLDRSIGSVTEDLLLASWIETHKQVEEFSTIAEALSFVRAKKLEMRIR
jgi:hypothetical protein